MSSSGDVTSGEQRVTFSVDIDDQIRLGLIPPPAERQLLSPSGAAPPDTPQTHTDRQTDRQTGACPPPLSGTERRADSVTGKLKRRLEIALRLRLPIGLKLVTGSSAEAGGGSNVSVPILGNVSALDPSLIMELQL